MSDITSRCVACRFWQKPPLGARKPIGQCQVDRRPTHAGYTCPVFAHKAEAMMHVLGLTEGEITWLKANPDDRATKIMRLEFALVFYGGDHYAFANFEKRLNSWRVWRDGLGIPPVDDG